MTNERGVTLRKWSEDRNNFTPGKWEEFYDSVTGQEIDRGALPFRIEQVFVELVKAVQAGNVAKTVFAAGIIAHYAGDATMPLHGIVDYKGELYGTPSNSSRTVHKFYDREIIERCATDFSQGMESRLSGGNGTIPAGKKIADGHAAALETLAIMNWAFDHCPTEKLFKAYAAWWESRDDEATWSEIGGKITDAAFAGAKFVARLWQGAWEAADGDRMISRPTKVPAEKLRSLYYNKSCLESVNLTELQTKLGY
jgi:hypothetical protein